MDTKYVRTSFRFPDKGTVLLLSVVCGLGSLTHVNSCAEEGGSGHYLPGSIASFVNGVPLGPTFIMRYNMAYYKGDAALNQPLPIAEARTLGPQAISWGHGLSFAWRPPFDRGDRWSCALSATIPFVCIPVIELLPALPKAWSNGSVSGLCARGGFEVAGGWADGKLAKAVVTSLKGNPCKVKYGATVRDMKSAEGETFRW